MEWLRSILQFCVRNGFQIACIKKINVKLHKNYLTWNIMFLIILHIICFHFFASKSIQLIKWIVIKNNEQNHYQSFCTKYLSEPLYFFACSENKSTAIVNTFVSCHYSGNFILPLIWFLSIPWKSKHMNFCRLLRNFSRHTMLLMNVSKIFWRVQDSYNVLYFTSDTFLPSLL
jgi:hypothetical protein